MVIQPYCQFHFQPIPSLEFSDLWVYLDKFLILDRYLLLEAVLRGFYFFLPLYNKQEIEQNTNFTRK